MNNKTTGPLYHKIKVNIKERIESGEWVPGSVLPTENELCDEYGVSRITVRRALSELIADGVLDRGFGRTATVKYEAVPRSVNSLSSLTEELEAKGIKCSSYILAHELISADEELAQKMSIAVGDPVMRIERLRYADGAPLCYQLLYLNYSLCEGFDPELLVSLPLFRVLTERFNIKIQSAEQTVTASISTFRLSALLELPEPTAMLDVTRTSYDANGVCFEYCENKYVASRYYLTMALRRDQ